MGTTELALPRIVEILGPDGEYQKRRISLKSEYSAVVEEAKKITAINDAESAEEATKIGRLLQVASKETEAFFKGIKGQVDAIKKPILDAEKSDGGPYESEKKRIGILQSAWDQKMLREQQEAERKAREEAEARAREEALLRAIEHESIGDMEGMEQVLAEPIVVAPVVTLSKSVRPKGSVNPGIDYKAKVTNLMDLVKAVANGRVPLNALLANESFLNRQAHDFKDAFNFPGVALEKSIPPTTYRQ